MMEKNKNNQFSPGFGSQPTTFLGRKHTLAALTNVIKGNSNSVFRRTLISGVRGVGKTTLLNEAEKELSDLGALVVTQTSSDALGDHIIRALAEHVDKTELAGMSFTVNLGVVSGKLDLKESSSQPVPDIYLDGLKLLDKLNAKSRWVVFQIDEVHGHIKSVQEFAKAFQQWSGNGYQVMLVMAGLPDELLSLLNNESVSFLRRAKRIGLAAIENTDDIANMYVTAFEKSGKSISDEHAQRFAKTSEGYPYLIQLLGYYAWEETNPNQAFPANNTSEQHVYDLVKKDMYSSVFDLLFRDKSAQDITYLSAVSSAMGDKGVAKSGEVAKAFGKSLQYTGSYRQRALDSGLIVAAKYGEVKFTIPMISDYISDLKANKTLSNIEFMD